MRFLKELEILGALGQQTLFFIITFPLLILIPIQTGFLDKLYI